MFWILKEYTENTGFLTRKTFTLQKAISSFSKLNRLLFQHGAACEISPQHFNPPYLCVFIPVLTVPFRTLTPRQILPLHAATDPNVWLRLSPLLNAGKRTPAGPKSTSWAGGLSVPLPSRHSSCHSDQSQLQADPQSLQAGVLLRSNDATSAQRGAAALFARRSINMVCVQMARCWRCLTLQTLSWPKIWELNFTHRQCWYYYYCKVMCCCS